MPFLQRLAISLGYRLGQHSNTFVHLFECLQYLQTFVLNNGRLTSEMIRQLSLGPSLRRLESNYGVDEVADQELPRVEPDSFPCLRQLALTVGIQNITRFLKTGFDPRLLTALEVTISPLAASTAFPNNETPHVQNLFVVVASRCPSLQTLVLDILSHSSSYIGDPPNNHIVTFQTLEPLMTCQGLRQFSISHEHHLLLQAPDVQRLIRCWPLMESLSLNPHPISLTRAPISIEILKMFSVLCPNIRHLGLQMDVRREAIKILNPFWHSNPIKSLTTLDVGTSELASSGWEITASAYIAYMCPNLHAVVTSAPWKGRLQELRNQALRLPQDPGDRLHIIYVEKHVAFRSNSWAACEKLILRLIKSARDRSNHTVSV
jgi:hypothetical protein